MEHRSGHSDLDKLGRQFIPAAAETNRNIIVRGGPKRATLSPKTTLQELR